MEERSYGKLEWVFYIIILPLLFTGLILGLVLQLMGYNVTGKLLSVARHTPGISSIVPPDEATRQERSEVHQLTSQLQETQRQLEAAQQANQTKDQDLQVKTEQLNQLQQQQADQAKQASDQQAADEYWQTQARVYSEMTPQRAADIFVSRPLVETRAVLGRMMADQRAAILEKMDPDYAALVESNSAAQNDQQSATDAYNTTQNVYSLMAPANAALILNEMPADQARRILNGLDLETRAAILENMDPQKAKNVAS